MAEKKEKAEKAAPKKKATKEKAPAVKKKSSVDESVWKSNLIANISPFLNGFSDL